jgi:hypothetical protein
LARPAAAAPRSAFLRAATDEEQLSAGVLGWLLLQARANAPNADVTLPLCTVLAMNITFALLPWWAAVALQPPILFTCTVLQYMAGLVPGVAELRSRMSAIVVAALLLAGVSVFLVTLAPAQLAARPNAVALEAVMFALNAVAFWKTVFTDPGFVPRGTAESASAPGAPRVCATCHCERPLRSKHDPFIGRCVRCAVRLAPAHASRAFRLLTRSLLRPTASSTTTARWSGTRLGRATRRFLCCSASRCSPARRSSCTWASRSWRSRARACYSC